LQVFIVTGSSSGVGQALAQILYSHNAKVYVAVRSEEKAKKAISEIKANAPKSTGELIFLRLDLGDLTTIKRSAEEFLSKEDRLDVLWNNAGVMTPPQGSKTAQGYELQIGTNNVAPLLFTKLLTPILIKTAKTAPKGSVRVVWVSSSAAELSSPKNGVDMDNLDYKVDKNVWHKYGVSKASSFYHTAEYTKLHKDDGIVSVVSSTFLILGDNVLTMSRPSTQATSEPISSDTFQAGRMPCLASYSTLLSMEHIPSYTLDFRQM
jgi:retinol dehydrogenase 12